MRFLLVFSGALVGVCASVLNSHLAGKEVRDRRERIQLCAGLGSGTLCGVLLPLHLSQAVWQIIFLSVFFVLLFAALSDIRTKTIPNFLSLSLLMVFAALQIYNAAVNRADFLAGMAGGFLAALMILLFLLLCRYFSKGGVGMGDIKLLTSLALILGMRGMFSLLFFSELIAVCQVIFLLVRKKMTLHDALPFAPYFLLGFLATVGFGLF